jgi:CDP-diglyceride synthetase
LGSLVTRTVTALIYAAVLLGAAFAPPPAVWALVAVLFLLSTNELAAIARKASERHPGLQARQVFLAGLSFFGGGLLLLGLLKWLPELYDRSALPSSFWMLLALLPTWAADVAAYLLGSAIGRRKLAPTVSPGKTWEGTIAGVLAAALVVVSMGIGARLDPIAIGFVAVTIGPLGLAADLIESMFKRLAGVKDSGTLLPGHGGVLDRIDSLMLSSVPVLLVSLSATSGMMER